MNLRSRILLAATPLVLAVVAFAGVAAHAASSTLAAGTVAAAALAASAMGLAAVGLIASRSLRPVATIADAVEEFGRGDLAVRAQPRGSAELRAFAGRFNLMADRIEESRRISLGEMLYARLASAATLDSLPDPVFVFDRDGVIITLNRAAQRLLSPGDGARPSLHQVDPALRAALDGARWQVLRGKGPVAPQSVAEAVAPCDRPRGRCFLPRAAPVYGPGGDIVAATVLLQDVTRLRSFDELRSDLVPGLAQRLRTPLTSMLMAIHLCLEGIAGELSDEQQDLLRTAREECERLRAEVEELLELARLQSATASRQAVEHPCR